MGVRSSFLHRESFNEQNSALVYRIVSFLVAVGIVCFNAQTNGIVQPLVNTPIWLFVLLLVGWTALTGWEASSSPDTSLRSVLSANRFTSELGVTKDRAQELLSNMNPKLKRVRTQLTRAVDRRRRLRRRTSRILP